MFKIALLLLSGLLVLSHPVSAQENAKAANLGDYEVDTVTGNPQIEEMVRRALEVDKAALPAYIPSVFFTPREQNLIDDARKGVVARSATDSELRQAQEGSVAVPKGPREISVSGILFVDSNDWTVWLNDQKITPEKLPSEIADIEVGRDYVKLKWFDEYTNQIYPIKLRSHQRFNLDTRIFLPG